MAQGVAQEPPQRSLGLSPATGRVDLLCIDELGYMELDKRGAELLFQVLTEREEKSSVAIASNQSFSGWTNTSDPACVPRSSTASPSAATSSKPAATPTASPTAPRPRV